MARVFMRTSDLVHRLQIVRRELALESALAKLDKYHLLILDDIVYVPQQRQRVMGGDAARKRRSQARCRDAIRQPSGRGHSLKIFWGGPRKSPNRTPALTDESVIGITC
jgi:hypothetical protein